MYIHCTYIYAHILESCPAPSRPNGFHLPWLTARNPEWESPGTSPKQQQKRTANILAIIKKNMSGVTGICWESGCFGLSEVISCCNLFPRTSDSRGSWLLGDGVARRFLAPELGKDSFKIQTMKIVKPELARLNQHLSFTVGSDLGS